MSDSWCEPFWDGNQWLYGGAARNARLSAGGGMEKIIKEVATNAAAMAINAVNQAQNAHKVVPFGKRKVRKTA